FIPALHRDLPDLDAPQIGLGAMISAQLEPDQRALAKRDFHRREELRDALGGGQCRSLVVRNLILGKSCLARSAHQAFCARNTGAPLRSSAILAFWAAMNRSSSLGSSLSIQRATS